MHNRLSAGADWPCAAVMGVLLPLGTVLRWAVAFSAITIGICGADAPAEAKPAFTTFIVGDVQTTPTAINKSGDIAGTFTQSDGTVSGFIVESGGLTRKFFHPGQSLL